MIMITYPTYSPCQIIQIGHHYMKGTRTLGAKVFQRADVTIIDIDICVGGELVGLMNARAPLMDRRI